MACRHPNIREIEPIKKREVRLKCPACGMVWKYYLDERGKVITRAQRQAEGGGHRNARLSDN